MIADSLDDPNFVAMSSLEVSNLCHTPVFYILTIRRISFFFRLLFIRIYFDFFRYFLLTLFATNGQKPSKTVENVIKQSKTINNHKRHYKKPSLNHQMSARVC